MGNGKLVKIESAANLVQDLRNKASAFGFSPKQAKAAIGRLTRGQDEAFRASLVTWVNEAQVSDDHRAAVAAQRSLLEVQGRKPWDAALDEGPAVLNEDGRFRVSFAQAVAWAHAVSLETGVEGGVKAVLDARAGTTARGLLRKLGLSAQSIGSRFPELSRNRGGRGGGGQTLTLPEDPPPVPGGGAAAGRQVAAAPAQPQAIDPLRVLDALMAHGAVYSEARKALEGKTFQGAMQVLDLFMAFGFAYGEAREAVDKLAQ